MELKVWVETDLVGVLRHDASTNQFAFDYVSEWVASDRSFPLAPTLPLEAPTDLAIEQHSRLVRTFFENLLPEGQALDDVAAAYAVSKANTIGLIAILGRETAGALRILRGSPMVSDDEVMRRVSPDELAGRIRERPQQPFTIWDQKVRLSIAGYQDKIAVYQPPGGQSDDWFLVEGSSYASTHILKPEPVNARLAGLVSNEFFCMRLARAADLSVADVRLHRLPEPLLCIKRFDRQVVSHGVRRLPVIDGCQALGLSTLAKYERPYGSSRDVKDIRTGATLPGFFGLLKFAAQPMVERLKLLRWVIYQVLIGNTDAHAKNLTFFNGVSGLSLAPAYDLVCGLMYADLPVEDSFAMAVGDAFTLGELSTYEWVNLAETCELPPALVQKELLAMSQRVLAELENTRQGAVIEGADPRIVEQIVSIIKPEAERQMVMAKGMTKLARSLGTTSFSSPPPAGGE